MAQLLRSGDSEERAFPILPRIHMCTSPEYTAASPHCFVAVKHANRSKRRHLYLGAIFISTTKYPDGPYVIIFQVKEFASRVEGSCYWRPYIALV
mmetsp:Transcript_18515/g.30447  ORF Transcript_18515/g.30447 Transcript_18515/m.30447 type:complete len:95 (+) Transcript_18515:1344-1628(+)